VQLGFDTYYTYSMTGFIANGRKERKPPCVPHKHRYEGRDLKPRVFILEKKPVLSEADHLVVGLDKLGTEKNKRTAESGSPSNAVPPPLLGAKAHHTPHRALEFAR